MKKRTGNLSFRATRILFGASGAVFLVNAVIQAFNRPEEWWSWILVIGMTVGALANLGAAFVVFSPNSRYAPRVEINQSRFLFKQDVFQPAHVIEWASIRKITLASYQVIFNLKDDTAVDLPINTGKPEISREVKAIIRKEAKDQGIVVVDG